MHDDDTLTLPAWLGVGFIQWVWLALDFSLLIQQYVLTEDAKLTDLFRQDFGDSICTCSQKA